MVNSEIRLIMFFLAEGGEPLPGADCGSERELLTTESQNVW